MRLLALFLPMFAIAAADQAEKSERLPIPDAAAQAKAEKTIKDVFKAEYTKKKIADQLDLAGKLIKQAEDTGDDPAARFVLLREARELAAKAGDALLTGRAVEEIVRLYDVPPLKAKVEMLEILERSVSSPAASKPVFEQALDAVEVAVAVDDYEAANKLVKVAIATAARTKVAANNAAAAARAKDLERLKFEFDKTKPDREVLKNKPDDPSAAERVGRFLCLFKGDWSAGLPLLVKGKDEKLVALARKDLDNPETAAARIELGDAWFDLAATSDKDLQPELQLRAQHWYKLAIGDLTGLTRTRIEKRMAEIEKSTAGRGSGGGGASGWTILFRSSDPSIWNQEVRKGPNHQAIKLDQAPKDIRFLRMTEPAKSSYVIIPMTKERLPKQFEQDGIGWTGTAHFEWEGRQLGIYDPEWNKPKRGDVVVYVPGFFQGIRGWGFGPCFEERRQGYAWNGVNLPKATVLEIAVNAGELTFEESKHLLKKKGKN
jgi:hypothetical protein